MSSGNHPRALKPLLLIPIAVLLTIHPLLIHGPSCGQDLAFHVQSWLDAAQQLRHGTLYPHWDITAAWNAGEPRFLFYPPLSWLLGAFLTLIFPTSICPTLFIAIALLASGLTFHKLASSVLETRASPNAALVASALYVANPYMLFTAFERSAFAELLAAAWIPLLLLALLRRRPTIRSIAIPLALLWLTNVPAAVIGSYTLALLATLRLALCLCFSGCHSERSEEPASRAQRARSWLNLTLTYLAGAILGLTLPAIYLLPAACERRFIQTPMAIIPNLRYQDNFLFTHTADAAHNAVNHTASTLALTLLLLTAAALLTLLLRKNRVPHVPGSPTSALARSRGVSPLGHGPATAPQPIPRKPAFAFLSVIPEGHLLLALALLTLTIALLLFPFSAPIWQHLPDLAYLQFPWRLLTLLTPILALTIALLLDTLPRARPLKLSPSAQVLTLLLPLALTALAYHLYRQPCGPTDNPATLAHLFATHHGFPPTDEYTPTLADNDPLRTGNPAYWLLPLSGNQAADPNTPAPHTLPTATELNPSLDSNDTDDTPIPPTQTLSTPAPHHLTLNLPQPSLLVLNLRDYPNWQVTDTDDNFLSIDHPPHIPRNDGLIAIRVAAGRSTINIAWRRTLDEQLGLALSAISLIALVLTFRRRV
jgi:hypothetical protein